MRQRPVMLAAIFAMATLPSSAYAHHSHPYFYDECNSVTLEARVDRIEFKDPHTVIVLRSDDGTAYTVDWAPLSRLTREQVIGPAKEALVPGARVVVTGNRIRPVGQIREHFPDFTGDVNLNTVDPVSIRRVGASFNWALPPSTNLPTCNGK